MRNILRILALLAVSIGLASVALAAGLPGGVAQQLMKNTGVYNRPATAHTPDFVSDPSWPQTLPHSWRLGQVAGFMSTATIISGSITGPAP